MNEFQKICKLEAKLKKWKKAYKELEAGHGQLMITNEKLQGDVKVLFDLSQELKKEKIALNEENGRMLNVIAELSLELQYVKENPQILQTEAANKMIDKLAVEHNIEKSRNLFPTLDQLKENHVLNDGGWRCYDCQRLFLRTDGGHDADKKEGERGTTKICHECYMLRKSPKKPGAKGFVFDMNNLNVAALQGDCRSIHHAPAEPPVGEIGLPEPVMPIVNSFRDMGVKLSLQGDKVAISGPESKCTDEVIEMVRKDKQKIIAELSAPTPRKKLSPGVF